MEEFNYTYLEDNPGKRSRRQSILIEKVEENFEKLSLNNETEKLQTPIQSPTCYCSILGDGTECTCTRRNKGPMPLRRTNSREYGVLVIEEEGSDQNVPPNPTTKPETVSNQSTPRRHPAMPPSTPEDSLYPPLVPTSASLLQPPRGRHSAIPSQLLRNLPQSTPTMGAVKRPIGPDAVQQDRRYPPPQVNFSDSFETEEAAPLTQPMNQLPLPVIGQEAQNSMTPISMRPAQNYPAFIPSLPSTTPPSTNIQTFGNSTNILQNPVGSTPRRPRPQMSLNIGAPQIPSDVRMRRPSQHTGFQQHANLHPQANVELFRSAQNFRQQHMAQLMGQFMPPIGPPLSPRIISQMEYQQEPISTYATSTPNNNVAQAEQQAGLTQLHSQLNDIGQIDFGINTNDLNVSYSPGQFSELVRQLCTQEAQVQTSQSLMDGYVRASQQVPYYFPEPMYVPQFDASVQTETRPFLTSNEETAQIEADALDMIFQHARTDAAYTDLFYRDQEKAKARKNKAKAENVSEDPQQNQVSSPSHNPETEEIHSHHGYLIPKNFHMLLDKRQNQYSTTVNDSFNRFYLQNAYERGIEEGLARAGKRNPNSDEVIWDDPPAEDTNPFDEAFKLLSSKNATPQYEKVLSSGGSGKTRTRYTKEEDREIIDLAKRIRRNYNNISTSELCRRMVKDHGIKRTWDSLLKRYNSKLQAKVQEEEDDEKRMKKAIKIAKKETSKHNREKTYDDTSESDEEDDDVLAIEDGSTDESLDDDD